jgi:transposase
MRDKEWVILASDETRLMLEAITRRAWLKKGEKTVLKVQRSKESQYYIGFLNLKTGRDHLLEMAWGNEEEVIKAVEHIAHTVYPEKKICIIWDNVSYHKGKKLREKLGEGQSLERVHLMNFPPYAPDSNPQEAVWNRGKKHISNTQFKTFADTKRQFSHFVSTHIFDYTI